jgi:hypothetical protein
MADRARDPIASEVDRALNDPTAPAGAIVDAPREPQPDVVAAPMTPQQRRRVERDLSHQRAVAVSDLGGLVVEMARRERMRVDLLTHRASIVLGLEQQLAAVESPRAAATGVSGQACGACGTMLVAEANYCHVCGNSTLVDPPTA